MICAPTPGIRASRRARPAAGPRGTPRPWLLAAVWLAAATAVRAETAPLLDPQDRWIQVRTEHFVLFSNASEPRTQEIGANLERFRTALAGALRGLEVSSPVPTWVYVFKNDFAFRPYKKRVGMAPANISGEFAAHRDGNYVGIDASPPTDPWSVVYHEYFHYFLENNFGDIPLWFNEGMAECFSTFAADASHVSIGRPIENHLRLLRDRKWIPMSDLFAIDEQSKDYNEGDRQGVFYAESWVLAHYLAWGRPDSAARGVAFLGQFPARAELGDLLKPLVGPDWSALETRLVEYVKRGKLIYSILDASDLKVEPPGAAGDMPPAEILARLGDYLLRAQTGREADAEAYFRAAIAADPDRAPGYAGLAFLRDGQKRPADAAALYEKALARSPDDPLTLFLYAENLMERVTPSGKVTVRPAGEPIPAELTRARDLYRRSIRLRPDVAEAYAGLGATFMFEDGSVQEGIEALEKARQMMPSHLDVVINLAGLYARSGDRGKAQHLVERVLDRSGDRRAIDAGRVILEQADLKRADTLVGKGDYDAGVAILKEVRDRTRDPALRRQLDEHMKEIQDVRGMNEQINTYNRAVNLVNKRDYRQAASILEKLAPEVKDPKLAGEVRSLLETARRQIAAAKR